MKTRKSNLLILGLLIVPAWLSISMAQETNSNRIVDSQSKLELVFNDGFFTEGPAVGPDGLVYFSDITFTQSSGMQAGHIWRYNPDENQTTLFRSPSGMSNGIIFDLDGNMVIAQGADFGGRSIVRTNMKTGKSEIIAGLYNGKPLNSPNDLVIDEKGQIYFTDPRYIGHESVEQPVMGVYRINLDGSLDRVIEHAGTPNGILISPDQKYLYVASCNYPYWSNINAVIRFELDDEGKVKNREILIDFNGTLGPDGMTIDQEGNLYLTRHGDNPGIHIYSPEGTKLDYIATPEEPSNVTFGRGKTENFLFITAKKNLYKIKVNAKGYFPSK
ncbi:MAG: SMP-30/gluconolactonase/LRE family protein [Chitinophagaceae bacterium]